MPKTLLARGGDSPIIDLELEPTLMYSYAASEYKMTWAISGVSF